MFVDRTHRSSAGRSVKAIDDALCDGHLVVLFPEGTSSDGTTVLPFKSSLIEPVTRLACRTTTATLSYSLANGSVADEVCYWRDMTLLPHLLNLFTKRRIDGTIVFSESRVRSGDRKQLARELHDDVASSLKV
jgi:1-acyl-sn-glycerol-3-phosphate acyltransferase